MKQALPVPGFEIKEYAGGGYIVCSRCNKILNIEFRSRDVSIVNSHICE